MDLAEKIVLVEDIVKLEISFSLLPSLPSFLSVPPSPLFPHPYLLVYDSVKLDIYFCFTIQMFSDLKNRT